MAWKKYRKPTNQFDAVTPSWNMKTGVMQIEEYTCPKCGADAHEQQSVIARWKGWDDQIPFQVGATVPQNYTKRHGMGCRVLATKCRRCGLITSGSQALSTDMYVGKV